jgi:hypothetical protein
MGPLKAGEDLQRFIRRHQRSGGAPLWFLKIDIQNFFPSIDLDVLYQIVARKLKNPRYLWLVKTVIYHRATAPGNFMLTSAKELWKKLPRYKSLFVTPANKGMPIGNLPSQFLANVYMNELDQFITHRLKGRYLYWQRYVDDIVLLHTDREVLRDLVPVIDGFLGERLKLKLNPKKTQIQPLAHGLDHLGFVYKPAARLVRRRVAASLKAKLAQAEQRACETPLDPASLCASANSHLGYFRYADSWRLRESIARQVAASRNLKEVVQMDARLETLKLVPDNRAQLAAEAREEQLKEEFAENFQGDPDRRDDYLKSWLPMGDVLEWAGAAFADAPH